MRILFPVLLFLSTAAPVNSYMSDTVRGYVGFPLQIECLATGVPSPKISVSNVLLLVDGYVTTAASLDIDRTVLSLLAASFVDVDVMLPGNPSTHPLPACSIPYRSLISKLQMCMLHNVSVTR